MGATIRLRLKVSILLIEAGIFILGGYVEQYSRRANVSILLIEAGIFIHGFNVAEYLATENVSILLIEAGIFILIALFVSAMPTFAFQSS